MKTFPGRYTADIDGDFIVFLLGMRVNRPLRAWRWVPVARSMAPMLRVLDEHPELGCLGHEQWFGRTTVLVLYWRDFSSLEGFARDADGPHLEAWRRFARAVGDRGDVGVWHETYQIRAGEYEAIYGNMPVFGLAAAAAHVPVGAKGERAAVRIGAVGPEADADAPT